jgi:ABC-type nitrate/sulfonate/bicarbonate transport system substrate-binding protein
MQPRLWRRLPALALLLWCACGPPAAPPPDAQRPPPAAAGAAPAAATPLARQSISFGFPVRGALYWWLFVAQAKGVYDELGIDFEPVYVSAGSPLVVQSTESGSYQISAASDPVILANLRGADVAYIAGGTNKVLYSLIVQPDVDSYGDLRGKTFGAASIRGGTSTLLRKMLADHGLVDGRDYSVVAAGSTNERYTALRTGAIVGGMMGQPEDLRLMDEGYRRLGLTSDSIPLYAFAPLFTNRAWARANAELVVRFLRGHLRTLAWLNDPANKEEAIAILSEATNTEERYARQTYEMYVEQGHAFPDRGELPLEAIEWTLRVMADGGELEPPLPPASRFLDATYWERAVTPP